VNGISKWLLGVMLGIILGGAGWNETRQWKQGDETRDKTNENTEHIASMKEAIDTIKKNTEVNNDKNDKILRKLDVILEKRK